MVVLRRRMKMGRRGRSRGEKTGGRGDRGQVGRNRGAGWRRRVVAGERGRRGVVVARGGEWGWRKRKDCGRLLAAYWRTFVFIGACGERNGACFELAIQFFLEKQGVRFEFLRDAPLGCCSVTGGTICWYGLAGVLWTADLVLLSLRLPFFLDQGWTKCV